MNKVITINLNGRAYQLEQAGFEALQTYLEQTASKLRDNPDKDEIMADFEQAIAEKCERYLNQNKSVILTTEIQTIISEMGPVESESAPSNTETPKQSTESEQAAHPKKLYLIMEGAYIGGVCNGIAAYFDVDVTLVRALFIILAILTKGAWVLVYFILMMIIPVARTSEERAEARGEHFSASEIIEKARAKYASMGGNEGIKQAAHRFRDDVRRSAKSWKQSMHEWKQEMHHEVRNEVREARRQGRQERYDQVPFGWRMMSAFWGLAIGFLSIAWIFALWSLVFKGLVFGIAIGLGQPLWVSLLFITAVYFVLLMPLQMAARPVISYKNYQADTGSEAVGGTLFWLLACVGLVYSASLLFPQVHVWLNELISQVTKTR